MASAQRSPYIGAQMAAEAEVTNSGRSAPTRPRRAAQPGQCDPRAASCLGHPADGVRDRRRPQSRHPTAAPANKSGMAGGRGRRWLLTIDAGKPR